MIQRMLRLLTHHSQEAQPVAGRKDRPEGSPVGHMDPQEGSSGSPAERMDLGQDSFAEAEHIAHMGLQQVQGRRRALRQQLGQQLCARRQNHLQSVISIRQKLPIISSSLYIPRAFIKRAPPARPAAAPPAPYN